MWIGRWLAGQLLRGAWDKIKAATSNAELLAAFERACVTTCGEFESLFPEKDVRAIHVTEDVSPEEVFLGELEQLFDGASFPTERQVEALLSRFWSDRKQDLESRGEEGVPFFAQSSEDVAPVIRRLSECFCIELAQIDRYRNAFQVASLQRLIRSTERPVDAESGIAVHEASGRAENLMLLGVDPQEPNAPFEYALCFRFLAHSQSITVSRFEVLYFARGCPCLHGGARLSWDGEDRTVYDGELRPPYRIEREGVATARYRRVVRPPLMRFSPLMCEGGDFLLMVEYRRGAEAQLSELSETFRFDESGALRKTSGVREVPRLSDKELSVWLARNALSPEQHRLLVSISATQRYMGAMSDNTSWFVEYPSWVGRVLRDLLKRGAPEEL